MKIYNFIWTWYESYQPHIFIHKNDKSEEEFKADCIKALKETGNDYIDKEESWVSLDDWINFSCSYMINTLGYELPIEVAFSTWGNSIIKKEDGYERYYEELVE